MNFTKKRIAEIFGEMGLEDVYSTDNAEISRHLPIHFSKTFAFINVSIESIDASFIMLEVLKASPEMNEILEKYDWLRKKDGLNHYVLAFPKLTTFMKKHLLFHQIPFIDGSNQIFLPFVGLSLKNTSQTDFLPVPKQLTPSEQVVFLTIMYNLNTMRERVDALFLIEKVNLSKPTVYRALDTLTGIGIFEIDSEQSYRNLFIIKSARELWDEVSPLLINPVRKTIYLEREFINRRELTDDIYLTSLNALSMYTNIVEEDDRTYAISGNSYKKLAKEINENKTDVSSGWFGSKYYNKAAVEIWKYSPIEIDHLVTMPCVDPLSLYLAMQGTDDPRIESELEVMLEEVLGGKYDKRREY